MGGDIVEILVIIHSGVHSGVGGGGNSLFGEGWKVWVEGNSSPGEGWGVE